MTLLLVNTYHAFAIANALHFWYEFFPIFPINSLISLIEVLIKFYFYDLFLHWSKNVRMVFYFILIYRILTSYSKDPQLYNGELHKLILLLNKRINIISICGQNYKEKLMNRGESRFGTKNRIIFLRNQVLELFE